ncbi:MAG: hypothetical protein J6V24_00535, partial [Clostridia bacterium]|nr:hypothetical protein [Clostridia bacterium]
RVSYAPEKKELHVGSFFHGNMHRENVMRFTPPLPIPAEACADDEAGSQESTSMKMGVLFYVRTESGRPSAEGKTGKPTTACGPLSQSKVHEEAGNP